VTQDDAQASLAAWLRDNGHEVDGAVVATWSPVDAGHDSWIFTPPGMMNAVFVVMPTGVRPVRPSEENLGDVLAELGLS
jgi:hypothetical protein